MKILIYKFYHLESVNNSKTNDNVEEKVMNNANVIDEQAVLGLNYKYNFFEK